MHNLDFKALIFFVVFFNKSFGNIPGSENQLKGQSDISLPSSDPSFMKNPTRELCTEVLQNDLTKALEILKSKQVSAARQDTDDDDDFEFPEYVPQIIKVVGSLLAGNTSAVIDNSFGLFPTIPGAGNYDKYISNVITWLTDSVNEAKPRPPEPTTNSSSTPASAIYKSNDTVYQMKTKIVRTTVKYSGIPVRVRRRSTAVPVVVDDTMSISNSNVDTVIIRAETTAVPTRVPVPSTPIPLSLMVSTEAVNPIATVIGDENPVNLNVNTVAEVQPTQPNLLEILTTTGFGSLFNTSAEILEASTRRPTFSVTTTLNPTGDEDLQSSSSKDEEDEDEYDEETTKKSIPSSTNLPLKLSTAENDEDDEEKRDIKTTKRIGIQTSTSSTTENEDDDDEDKTTIATTVRTGIRRKPTILVTTTTTESDDEDGDEYRRRKVR